MGNVSEQFVHLCEQHRLTNKADIARMIGRSRQHVAAIFRGSVEASEDTLRRLEDSFEGRKPFEAHLEDLKERLSQLPEGKRLLLVKRTIQKADDILSKLEKEPEPPSP